MRFKLLSMAFLMVCTSCASGQQIAKVYPRYAIAGQETLFTAEGSGFPSELPASLGMKFSTTPVPCTHPRRYQPVTARHYRFACTFASGPPTAHLKIYVKDKKRDGAPLWQDNIQVLAGPPQVSQVFIKGAAPDGATRVSCGAAPQCAILQGSLLPGQLIEIEVTGANLPGTLRAEVDSCDKITAASSPSTERRVFSCTPQAAGAASFRILTGRADEGGLALHQGTLEVSQPVGEAAQVRQ